MTANLLSLATSGGRAWIWRCVSVLGQVARQDACNTHTFIQPSNLSNPSCGLQDAPNEACSCAYCISRGAGSSSYRDAPPTFSVMAMPGGDHGIQSLSQNIKWQQAHTASHSEVAVCDKDRQIHRVSIWPRTCTANGVEFARLQAQPLSQRNHIGVTAAPLHAPAVSSALLCGMSSAFGGAPTHQAGDKAQIVRDLQGQRMTWQALLSGAEGMSYSRQE